MPAALNGHAASSSDPLTPASDLIADGAEHAPVPVADGASDGPVPMADGGEHAPVPIDDGASRALVPVVDRQPVAAPAAREVARHYVRPLAARDIRGLAHVGSDLLVLDTRTGRVAVVDPRTDDTRVVNDGATAAFVGARGLAVADGAVWFAAEDGVRRATWRQGLPLTAGEVALPVVASAVAVAEERLYLVVGHELHEYALNDGAPDPEPLRAVPLHGVGSKGLSATSSNLWLSDDVEQAVYCLDRATLQTRFTAITPLEGPTAIAAHDAEGTAVAAVPSGGTDQVGGLTGVATGGRVDAGGPDDAAGVPVEAARDRDPATRSASTGSAPTGSASMRSAETGSAETGSAETGSAETGSAAIADPATDVVHVAYYEDEPYLRDNPWIDPCWEVRYRDRALVHRLHVHHDPAARAAWSSGHRLVMHYYVEVRPDAAQAPLDDVLWRMALPLDTPRQRLVAVEPIGLPFEIVDEPDGVGAAQRVAVFSIPRLDPDTRPVLGWRATLEVFGIKHQVRAADLSGASLGSDGQSPELAQHYLVDDEDLDLDTPQIAQATLAAVAGQDNPWLAARQIRTWVYDRLEYEMGNADSPVRVLDRGTGSCGEYVSTIMALLRRAGIACRVAGRYKCPYQPWSGDPLYPDFNHVWVDVHLPGFGWMPMESNPDDVVDGGPYPDRFFLGLPWRHVEVGKDISFEKVTFRRENGRRSRIGARRLSRNHIRFDIQAELAPVAR